LFFPATASRWVLYSLGAGGVLVLAHWGVALSFSSGPAEKIAAIFVYGIGGAAWGLWLATFGAALLAIVEDTANGLVEVEGWADWNPIDWFLRAFRVVAAAFVSGLPGFFAAAFLATGGMSVLVAPLPVVASWVALFPVVMYSMLIEDSVLAPVSSKTMRSFRRASEAWMLFYLYSVILGILGGGFATLTVMPSGVANMIGGAGLVTIAFVYCRVLGRLMWYCEEKAAKLPDENDS